MKFTPPHEFEIPVRTADGIITRRLMLAQDMAEALGAVLRDLPEGAQVVAGERCRTAWNQRVGRFEQVCGLCDAAGLVLERRRRKVLERHAWCCGGDPSGEGWELAQARARVSAMSAASKAAWLDANPDLAGETPEVWTPTGTVCVGCHTGQLEGLLTKPGGHWRVRCRGCGVYHATSRAEMQPIE
ncbi:MAG: hypothetical protein V4858_09835 [Pseudomonadota bacterium]